MEFFPEQVSFSPRYFREAIDCQWVCGIGAVCALNSADHSGLHRGGRATRVRKQSPKSLAFVLECGQPVQSKGAKTVNVVDVPNSIFRILVVSLHDEKLFAEKALAAGADGYVNKREPLEQVLCAVRRVAEGHVYLSQEATEQVLLRRAGGPLQVESSGPALSSLSARELEIFGLLGRGYKTAEIAERLFISSKTVYSHIERLKQKLGFPSMTELVREAVTWSNSQGA